MVAKTYQGLPCGTPYEKNKRMYVMVTKKDGTKKEVRWYTEKEYAKMYPDETVIPAKDLLVKSRLGFSKTGCIHIVTGDIKNKSDWLKQNPDARYNIFFGWHFFDKPDQSEISTTELAWEKIALNEYELRPIPQMNAVVKSLGGDASII